MTWAAPSGVAAEACVAALQWARARDYRRHYPLQEHRRGGIRWAGKGGRRRRGSEPARQVGKGSPAAIRTTPSFPRHRPIQPSAGRWIPRHKTNSRTCRWSATGGVGRADADVRGDRKGALVGGNRRRPVNPNTNEKLFSARAVTRRGRASDWARNDTRKVSWKLDLPNVSRVCCRCEPCRMRMGNVGGGEMSVRGDGRAGAKRRKHAA